MIPVRFSKHLVITLCFSLLSVFAQGQSRRLATKEAQIQSLDEALYLIAWDYGGLGHKQDPKMYKSDLEKLKAKYQKMILDATTVAEAHGFTPKQERAILDRNQFRDILVALSSELHDGHVNMNKPISRATVMGLRTAALNGSLYVTGVRPKYLNPVREDQKAQVNDEITRIDGKAVSVYKTLLLNFVGNGTIEARKDEANERILEIPHAMLSPFSTKATVDITFRRDGIEFTNTYKWKDIDPIELTRPLSPAELPKEGSPYEKDQPLVFGAKGMVRSYFIEGMDHLSNAVVKSTGKPLFEFIDVGAAINLELTAQFKTGAAKITLSQIRKEEQILSTHDANKLVGGLAQAKPIDRLKAYMINDPRTGKKVGMIRLPSYAPDGIAAVYSEINWIYMAMQFFKQDKIDTIIFDQLTNPGGYMTYAGMILGLFSSKDPAKELNGMRAKVVLSDRLLNDNYLHDRSTSSKPGLEAARRKFLEQIMEWIEKDGLRDSPPIPFPFDATFELENDNDNFAKIPALEGADPWEGKVLVLADSRSASCAEIVPALLQDNKRALIMGEKTMGLGNPLCHHFNALNYSEMDFSAPFADCERPNGEPEACNRHIENIGVVPDIHRTITIEDLKGKFVAYAYDVITAAFLYSAGVDKRQIQVKMNNRNLKPTITALLTADNTPKVKALNQLVDEMKADFAAVTTVGELESPERSLKYAAIYRRFFTQLKELEVAGQIPREAWKVFNVPLPVDFKLDDPILRTSSRKDVVLRRFEEMIEAERFEDKKNTLAMVDAISEGSKGIVGYYHFDVTCEQLLK